jgi:hypothetical protein
VLFRRALKVFNGGINAGVNNLPDSGLTVTTENGIYVQGNYNALSTDTLAEPNRPAAIIADAITILSNNWRDVFSLNFPNDYTQRDATSTGYRFAMIAGKSPAFPKPAWATLNNWGSDGGVHNFMRMLEDWGGQSTNYRGSMVSLYAARQMIGIFKNNSNTYTQGTRNFNFDTDFLTPSLVPSPGRRRPATSSLRCDRGRRSKPPVEVVRVDRRRQLVELPPAVPPSPTARPPGAAAHLRRAGTVSSRPPRAVGRTDPAEITSASRTL